MSHSRSHAARRMHAPIAAAFALAAAAALVCFALVGCGSSAATSADRKATVSDSQKVQVAASFYAMADFAEKIGGDRVKVTCLVPAGTEPHDWEPSTTDIKTLETADVFVYNGAGMEHWTEDTLASLSNKGLVSVEASEGVALRELGEGEGDAHEAEHAHEPEHEGRDHDHGGVDPHVWLAPQNAKIEMANVRDALIAADPEGKADYEANYATWAAECDKLDKEFSEGLAGAANRSIVVSHEAFGYLCDAYNLEQLPIEGIEADAEPDAKTMAEIVEFVKANGVKVIFSEELVSPKVANSIAEATGASVEELNPIEGLSEEDLAVGADYFSVMRANLEALKKALL